MPDRGRSSELIVKDASALHHLCESLRAAGVFGLDTEFIRERSYRPQLCLVQVASAEGVAVIDPLEVEIDEFWQLLQDGTVQKVLHGGQQDLEMCYLGTGRLPANIFDVQVAAGLVGLAHPMSYGNLVQHLLRAKVAPDATYTDWSQRPLTRVQLQYAVDDVVHLVPLKEKLHRRLHGLRREPWMEEEMQALLAEGRYAAERGQLWRRVRGWKQLGRRELGILRELTAWREQAAEKADTPPRTLLKDEVLTAVARRKPSTLAELQTVRGFPRPLVRKMGRDILKAAREGYETPKSKLPHISGLFGDSAATRMLTDLAAAVGESLCLAGKLSPNLLAGRGDYAALVRALRRKDTEADQVRLMTGWRRKFAGLAIRDVLTGRRKLYVKSLTDKPSLEAE